MKIDCAYDSLVDLTKLVPNPKNNNKHSDEQIKRLSTIIDFQGQRSPVVVSNRSGFVTKGHARIRAMILLEWEKCAVDYQDYENEAQEYADMTADNEIARWATLDLEQMKIDIQEFEDFDVEMLGLPDFELNNLDFEPGNEDDQGRLDVLEPKIRDCPHCGEKIDIRQLE